MISSVAPERCCILLTNTEGKTDVSHATFKLAGSAGGRLLCHGRVNDTLMFKIKVDRPLMFHDMPAIIRQDVATLVSKIYGGGLSWYGYCKSSALR